MKDASARAIVLGEWRAAGLGMRAARLPRGRCRLFPTRRSAMVHSVSVCPSCSAALFGDVKSCPECGHAIEGTETMQLAVETPRARQRASARSKRGATSSREVRCPECKERVHKASVRCWKCGAFLRRETAKFYRELKSTPQPVIYSDLPEEKPEDETAAGEKPPANMPRRPADDTGDDFSVGGGDDFVVDAGGPRRPVGRPESASGDPDETSALQRSHNHAFNWRSEGEALWSLALQEKAENAATRREPEGVIVFCPNGHRTFARESLRGRMGRCPKCKSSMLIPAKPRDESVEEVADRAGEYGHWIEGVRLHLFAPEKVKLRADSLKEEFELVDIGFAPERMLVVTVGRKGGLFSKIDPKKTGKTRDAVRDHLVAGKPLDRLPGLAHSVYGSDGVYRFKVVYPPEPGSEALFAGIPVFGETRIAVHLPKLDPKEPMRILTFSLSEFRNLARTLSNAYGLVGFGETNGIPLSDSYEKLTCHYTQATIKALRRAELYKADPAYELQTTGRRCQSCGIVMSEAWRESEKVGGANGAKFAKTKCRECKKPYGDAPLYMIKPPQPAAAPPAKDAGGADAAVAAAEAPAESR